MSDDLDELAIIERAHAPLELRSVETLEVRAPERVVEIMCAPYDVDQPVRRRGEWIVESFAPHSFDGVERRANRVKVNRDHDLKKTVGRAVALHPSRQLGLVAELRISRTPLGDETLELAADGVLDASVGFAPMPNGETWNAQRTRRRIERAYLGHISLVPDPAYEEARVLDVRSAASDTDAGSESRTPRLDQVLARLRELGYSPAPK